MNQSTDRTTAQTTNSSQAMDNWSFDPDFKQNTQEILGFNGVGLQRMTAPDLAIKVTPSGSITYVGQAAPGTDEATGKWQCLKIDSSSGCKVTYADGDANFDNVATDLTALTYV